MVKPYQTPPTQANRYIHSRYASVIRVDYENWVADIEWEQTKSGQQEPPIPVSLVLLGLF